MDAKEATCKRTHVKSKLTKFKSAYDAIKDQATADQESLSLLECKLVDALKYLNDFNEAQRIIETSQEGVYDYNERDTFEERYYSIISKAQNFLRERGRTDRPPNDLPTNDAPRNQAGNKNPVILPSLSLPKFSGDYDEWRGFSDNFRALIHRNRDLVDVEKLRYLLSCVVGKPAQIISPLEVTHANYEIAWKLLEDRYSNTRIVVNKHIAAIFDLPVIVKESAALMRDLVETVSRHIMCLKSLNEPVDQWDTLLIYILTKKLDPVTRRAWEARCSKDPPKVEDLFDLLRKQCETIEAVGVDNEVKQVEYAGNSRAGKVSNSARPAYTPQSRGQRSNAFNTGSKISCNFCSKEHRIYSCAQFIALPVNARRDEATKRRLCYKCLRNNHTVAQCSSGNCRTCARPHHSLLHYEATDTAKNNLGRLPVSEAQLGPVFSSSEILLSTAVINVPDSRGKQRQYRALLDNGSQPNFITEEAAKELSLRRKQINIKINGVNGTSSNVTEMITLRVQSRYNDFICDVDALVVPQITENPLYKTQN